VKSIKGVLQIKVKSFFEKSQNNFSQVKMLMSNQGAQRGFFSHRRLKASLAPLISPFRRRCEGSDSK